MFMDVDVAHEAARLGYQERLAKAIARDAVHRALAEPGVADARSPQARPVARCPGARRTFLPGRRLASLLR